jgi:DNA polymerase III subunit delta'
VVLIEPEGRDIRVGEGPEDGGTARWMVARAYLTAPEPGRKVFRVEQADRMTEEAADVLLKALEEPPADTVFILSSARPHEVPETVRSRCQAIAFRPLSEEFVVQTLAAEGIPEDRARLASRLAGGNLGRARRVARDEGGLAFRDVALAAYAEVSRGRAGALDAAEMLAEEAAGYKKRLAVTLREELGQFADPETGAPLEQYRGMVRRLQDRHYRQERRAERDFLDWSLLALEAWFRDAVVVGAGGDPGWAINLDREPPDLSPDRATLAIEAIEEARAALADETNLNPKLVVEEAFLTLAGVAAASASIMRTAPE